MSFGLTIRSDGTLDLLSLGALVHRLDPGIIPFRKASECQIHVSGGEFNVAANLADCFGLETEAICQVGGNVELPPAHVDLALARFAEGDDTWVQAVDKCPQRQQVQRAIRTYGQAKTHALYEPDDTLPPRPVQLVWKNSPRGLSTRS